MDDIIVLVSAAGILCLGISLTITSLLLHALGRCLSLDKYLKFLSTVYGLGEDDETKGLLTETVGNVILRVWKTFKVQMTPVEPCLGGFLVVIFLFPVIKIRVLLSTYVMLIVGYFILSNVLSFCGDFLTLLNGPLVRGIATVTTALQEGKKLELPVETVTPPNPCVEEKLSLQWSLLEELLQKNAARQHILVSLDLIDRNNPLLEENVKRLAERSFFPHTGHCHMDGHSKGEICLLFNKKPSECVLF
jgi:hypothetical protein